MEQMWVNTGTLGLCLPRPGRERMIKSGKIAQGLKNSQRNSVC